MMKNIKIVSIVAILLVASSCVNKKSNNKASVQTFQKLIVKSVERATFSFHEEFAGKIVANEFVNLFFVSPEIISKIYVSNGSYVKKGDIIAELDKYELNQEVLRCNNALKRADLELKDILIGQGYDPENIDTVPDEIMELVLVKSGYEQAKLEYESALHAKEKSTLKAPINGVIANLYENVHNRAQTAEPFCRIIASGKLEVEFKIQQNDLSVVSIGSEVSFAQLGSEKEYSGRVYEINPYIDEDGRTRVKARVDNPKGLMEGMNVSVNIVRTMEDKLFVPESAVILRDGKPCLFVCKEGKALLKYVRVGVRNESEVVIVQGLEQGDSVIVDGGRHLAEGTYIKEYIK